MPIEPSHNPQEQASQTPSKKLSGRTQSKQHKDESKAALERWFSTLRDRFVVALLRAFARSSALIGFLICCYMVGWWSPAAADTIFRYLPLFVFPIFALGLWFYGKHINLSINGHRWVMLLPAAFLLATSRHFVPWWLLALLLLLCASLSFLFHLLLGPKRPLGQRLIQSSIDLAILLVITTNFFLPRTLFGALAAFLPVVLLVVFYNFILERDRLLRAKALAIGDPPDWLRRANTLLPSSTYLFLLLPALLFSEAMLFHASFDLSHKQAYTSKAMVKTCTPQTKGNPTIAPSLRTWVLYTVTTRLRVKHCADPAQPDPANEEVSYWEFGRGYSLTAALIRGFLLFFYAKRLLLIFLLLMDSTFGIRVHKLQELEGVPGATPRLEEHREVIQRTLDSFPRAWAAFLLRGIQGRHGTLDPIGGIIGSIGWFKNQLIPTIIPGMKVGEAASEPTWSRLLREEQISLLGKMQDRMWAMEAFIDMVSPAHSSTFRGRAYHLLDYPILRPVLRLYFEPPAPDVRARLIEEMALIIERAVRSEEGKIKLRDSETDALTHDQVWTLRDRGLLVLKDLLQDNHDCIRLAAANAIASIADLPRPIREDDMTIWRPVADTITEHIITIAPKVAQEPEANTRQSLLERIVLTLERHDATPDNDAETPKTESTTDTTDSTQQHDPFARMLDTSLHEERQAMVCALGRVGIRTATESLLTLHEEESIPTTLALYALGLGEQANGRPQAGYYLAQKALLQTVKDSDNPEYRRVALKSFARIAFPQPVAHTFEKYVNLRRNLHRHHRALKQQHEELQTFEASRQQNDVLSIEERELLREAYEAVRTDATALEALAIQTLEPLHDTFWSTLHYTAVLLVAAYAEGEGFEHTPEFSEYLPQLSLEDVQGWYEFFAELPDVHDSMSWVAPAREFMAWVAGDESSTEQEEKRHIQRFMELQSLTRNTEREKEDVARWQELFALVNRYEAYLLDTLQEFALSLRVRPIVTVKLQEAEEESWWRMTLTGLVPWIQPLLEAPTHTESGKLYLAYEQYTPLRFHPVAEVTWSMDMKPTAMTHGMLPDPQIWSFSLTRASELILRKMGDSQGRGYWRAVERPGDLKAWTNQLQQLNQEEQNIPLDEIDFSYLHSRCVACYQQVFTRSRLREQDPLMIRRDMGDKLNNFLEHDRRTELSAPSAFLLAGDAAMGQTTLILQHARNRLFPQENTHTTHTQLTLLADVGLFEPQDTLASWLAREWHIIPPHDSCSVLDILHKMDAIDTEKQLDMCLYMDGFHEHPQGIKLFLEALQIATNTRDKFPWFRLVLSIRRSYIERHLQHPDMAQWTQEGQFRPNEELFYRERGGIHGMMIKLPAFLDEASPSSGHQRSELERAFARYYDFTDTSGKPRYRPNQTIAELEPFGMTRTLLARPSLLPVIMETFHQRALPDDLHVLQLFAQYTQQFSAPEQAFLRTITKRLAFGSDQPERSPASWRPQLLLQESTFVDDPVIAEYIEPFKHGTRVYDELRARGILIRRWRLATDKDGHTQAQRRHVTLTSHQLLEYLLFQELKQFIAKWMTALSLRSDELTPAAQELVDWLLEVARLSASYRPLEGALTLLLLHILEQHQYLVIAAFIDQSEQEQQRSRHFVFGAFVHLDPRALTGTKGPFAVMLQDISANDLELIQELCRHLKHRSLYQEVDQLCELVLDHPIYSEQLNAFPHHMTDLFLERADNRRQILAQQSGGRLDRKAYKEGRKYFEKALERVTEHTQNTPEQVRVLRFLALYELDTGNLEEASQTLTYAWQLTSSIQTDNPTEALSLRLNRAWIRHLQSALQRRMSEQADTPPSRKQPLLKTARELGEEALALAQASHQTERLELLAQMYDNIGRISYQLAGHSEAIEEKMAFYEHAIETLEGSIAAKRTLHDYLGMAISHSGLGEVYATRAQLLGNDNEPHEADWNEARKQLERAIRLNAEKLRSDFGIALGHQALAELYLLRPDMHSEGLASLVESLSAYARIHNTQGCQRIIQRLVQEVAKMPLQEMHRFLKQLVSELQRIQDLSEWLLKTLWDEFAAVLGNRIPKVLRDLFAKLIQS
jgi:hypothetical protein